jgi:hypothetical protein
VRAAQRALRRSLTKDADGPVSRLLNRPLSTRLSMVLAPLRPAPDLVSLVAFALGLAGAWPAPCWSTPARSPTGSMGRWPGSSSGAAAGGAA